MCPYKRSGPLSGQPHSCPKASIIDHILQWYQVLYLVHNPYLLLNRPMMSTDKKFNFGFIWCQHTIRIPILSYQWCLAKFRCFILWVALKRDFIFATFPKSLLLRIWDLIWYLTGNQITVPFWACDLWHLFCLYHNFLSFPHTVGPILSRSLTVLDFL